LILLYKTDILAVNIVHRNLYFHAQRRHYEQVKKDLAFYVGGAILENGGKQKRNYRENVKTSGRFTIPKGTNNKL
jgi:hypothetical protein